ncbi:unnamed protein product [Nezara viridula]|uniref:TOG domain-containing protein n=1 Tax=Nezara viridula TaxID=85310 RepID=A0A9P0HP86_NEZVI|nr:unnamed protein product [Nezara viridula]
MDEEDYTKLKLENACVHKVWKARLLGYEGTAKVFQQIEDEKSLEWNKYIGLVKRFVVDSHALCQEKGLEAVLLFVENCGSAGLTAGDVVSGIIQKCLAAPKARTRELASQVILMYIEIGKHEIVFDELIKGTESKNPKVVAACVHVLEQAVKEFGCKIINVSKLMKRLQSLLDDRDGNVRSQTKLLIGVVYHWIGPTFKQQLAAILKPAQLAEVETEYEKGNNIAAKATRFLRSQQTKKNTEFVAATIERDVSATEHEEFVENETDRYDLLEPVDILSKLDKNFYTKLESKKWSERKDVLEELEKQLAATPKLEPADYSEMIQVLKKIISKDSNVVVVGIAIKCVTGIANGLRKKFNQYVSLIIPALFEKFKEKKQNIVLALREAVDAVYLTTNLETFQEDVVTNLDNKNPCIKSELSGFLSRCFSKSTPNVLTKKLLKILCKGLSNGLRDQDPTVRDNCALALGTAMKVVGEKTIAPFLVEVDPLMLKKIKECCDKVNLLIKQPSKKINEGPKTMPEEVKAANPSSGKTDSTTSEKSQLEESSNILTRHGISQVDNQHNVDISNQITDKLVTELGDKNWEVRARAVAKLQGLVNSSQVITCNLSSTAASVIAARISDSNTKISASAIALVETLALAMGPSFKTYVRIFLPALMKAIGDPKIWIRSAVIPCFNTWGKVCGFKEFFEGEIIAEALKTGSTTVRSELWAWLANVLPNIPNNRIKKEELTACLPILYSNLEDRSSDVRKNASDAVLGFMLHLGFTNMTKASENIKGSSNSQVKQILERTRGTLPVQPMLQPKPVDESKEKINPLIAKLSYGSSATILSSKSKGNTPFSKSTTMSCKKENTGGCLLQVNSLKTQRIIDEQKLKTLRWNFITPTKEFFDLLREQMTVAKVDKVLVAHMFHNDFRYHIRAIDALSNDLLLNKEALIANLDLILRWMSLRFFDTNPSVLLKGLDYLNSVFSVLKEEEYSMMDSEASSFFPYLILKVGNPKDTVKNSVRGILKQISAVYPVSKQFFYLKEGMKSKNARQRSECLDQLSWLIENYGVSVCNPSPAGALKEIAKHIADRDISVRNAALNCVITAYFLEGEKTLKWVGSISGKNMSLLEEKIKRATKSPPMNIVKPLFVPVVSVDVPEDGEQYQDIITNIILQQDTKVSAINGTYGFDQTVIDKIESTTAHFQVPKLVDIDLQFMKDQIKPISIKSVTTHNVATISLNCSQPSAIIHELLNIDSNDIERAIAAISRIDIILNSENWDYLTEFVDLMVSQLVYLIIILNQSEHSKVINCYKADFSLFLRLCDHAELCSKITEATLYKVFEQLIYLLTEPRLDMLDEQDIFVTFVNNLVTRLLKNSNKTDIFCALLKMLYSTVKNSKVTGHCNSLVIKWIQTLNKSQSEWDSELNYCRLLYEIHIFLKDYPTSWWKNKADDFPLRTVKTILYTMVKIRGTEVREMFKRMPNTSKDTELYKYIKKTIKYIKVEEFSKDSTSSKENPRSARHPTPRISKETKYELSEIFQMIGDLEKMSQGMKRLFEFKKSHPKTDMQTFLSKATPQFQQFIMQGLKALEQKYLESSDTNKKLESSDNNKNFETSGSNNKLELSDSNNKLESSDSNKKETKSKEFQQVKGIKHLTEEAEWLWNRLKRLQEKLG